MHIYAKSILILLFIRLKEIRKRPELPKSAFIICSNHSSFIDIPCLYTMFDFYFTFTGKQEIEKWPLFRIFYTSGMNILVDRHNPKNAVTAMRRMINEIELNHPLMIFPEGTITKNAPHMGPFKQGAFQIAIQKQIPIVPVTFLTNFKRLERKSFFKAKASPGISKVIVHDPVSTAGLTKKDMEALQIKVRKIIEAPLFETTRE